jgi:hypothetical protein
MNAKRRNQIFLAVVLVVALPTFVACTTVGKKPQTDSELRGKGMIIDSRLAKGATSKEAVEGISDAGNEIFGFALLTPTGGDTSSFGGGTKMSFPRWVHVTWRQGPIKMNYRNNGYVGGTIIGDYKVEVLSRIPEDVFKYVAEAHGRAIVLRFRIKDDGVLFAWDVQERVVHPSGGRGLVFSLHGGDFPCENNPRTDPDCTPGRLEDAPWYNPLWTRG